MIWKQLLSFLRHAHIDSTCIICMPAANYIQDGDADVSCTAWLRTTLLGVVIHT